MKRTFAKLISIGLACGMLFTIPAFAEGSETEAPAAPSAQEQDIVNLKWVTVGPAQPSNYDAWQQKVNEYLAEKIGVNIDVEVVNFADWGNRRSALVNTAGDYDILFTNTETYQSDVQTGAFLDISDLVKTASPDLYSLIPEEYWKACEVDGKLYAVPTYKDSSASIYFIWDSELCKNAGVDPSGIEGMSPEMTEALMKLKDEVGGPSMPLSSTKGLGGILAEYDKMGAGLTCVGVKYNDPDGKAVFILEQDDIMDQLKTLHEWYEDGIINSDAATASEAAYHPCMMDQGWPSAAVTSWGPANGVAMEAYQYGPTIVSNDSVRGSMNGISANCKNPEKALEFLQLLNTDTWLRDSFFYGLEGENWEYTDDGRVHKNNTDWSMAVFTQAQFFNVTPSDEVDFNQWDEVKELNENAEPSVLLGFTLDTSEFSDELINCVDVWSGYAPELLTGTLDPETAVPQIKEELEDAGLDMVLEKTQEQIDAFLGK